MCGIAGIFGSDWEQEQLSAMVASQRHRGPDGTGIYVSPAGTAGLGHNRLSIIDLSAAGNQPMSSADERLWISFNGEIYNYLELRAELADYPYRSHTDTEVVLAAYERWGERCLEHFIGMFAFLIWDEKNQGLFAARDRFGVKPLYYHHSQGTLFVSSEIKALPAAGVASGRDAITWSTYLVSGLLDNSERTFWESIKSLPPGHILTWQNNSLRVKSWYNLADKITAECDQRTYGTVRDEYLELLQDSVRLRFRSDVPVGINVSGGLDSSTLLGVVQSLQGAQSEVAAYTFVTGDENYDELPWVVQMLAQTRHPLKVCRLNPDEVPELAESVQAHQDEPFGGLPTLCYARLFEQARADGVKVLLDGQGMDEQWAGYDYYLHALSGNGNGKERIVQGTHESPVRPDCLTEEFRSIAETSVELPMPCDRLRGMQYRDARRTKIPRALRFNDRVSMRSSTELREPFLDHRLFELAINQPPERKIANGQGKWFLRELTSTLLPSGIVIAPKRPLQTPQREWLRGPLRWWANECIEHALADEAGEWFDKQRVRAVWKKYCDGESDNSFYVWQWVGLGLMLEPRGSMV